MKTGLLLLIIGGGALVTGLVIAGISTFSITKQVLEGSTIIPGTSLEPNLSFASVMKGLPAGQQLLLTLTSNRTDVPLQASILQPNGTALAIFDIKETPFTSTVTIAISGDHTVEVKNVGSRSVTISGAVLNSPVGQQGGGVSVQDNPSLQNFVKFGIGILVGIILIIAGIVLLIIGAVKYIRGRKSTTRPSTTAQK
jgi:hypothetical protein